MLQELIDKCKCSVILRVNDHRDYYQTVEQYLKDIDELELDSEIRNKMVELNTIVNLAFYPNTPVGSYDIYHYSLEEAIKIALDTFTVEPKLN